MPMSQATCAVLSLRILTLSMAADRSMASILFVCFTGILAGRDGALYPLAGGSRRIRRGAFLASAARCCSTCSSRVGGAAAAGGAVDFHFSDIAVRGDDGARAIGANEPRGRRRQHP
jgi:hypothetical protein